MQTLRFGSLLFVFFGLISTLANAADAPPKPPLLGGAAIAFWEAVPASACETAIITQQRACGSSGVRCPGSLGEIQSAINASSPGDVIAVRGGVYQCSGANGACLTIAVGNNGTSTSRKNLCAYPGESVVIKGAGSPNVWNGATTLSNQGENENGIYLFGNYWTVQGLRFEWFGETPATIGGDFVYLYDNDFQYAYRFGVQVGNQDAAAADGRIDGYQFKWNRVRNIYRGGGHRWDEREHNILVQGGVVEYNIFKDIGYQSDGTPTPPGVGDGQGGGNADAIQSGNCVVTGPSGCLEASISWNLAINASDDCLDLSGHNLRMIGNIAVGCGPEGRMGWKNNSGGRGITLISNFVHGTDSYEPSGSQTLKEMENSYEIRTIGDSVVINNGGFFGAIRQFVGSDPTSGSAFVQPLSRNNVAIGPASYTNRYIADASDYSAADTAEFENCPPTLNWHADDIIEDPSLDGSQRAAMIYVQFAEQCQPAANSSLVDTGERTAYHCATADDDASNPKNPTDPSCIHWLGAAPDRGPFERGLW